MMVARMMFSDFVFWSRVVVMVGGHSFGVQTAPHIFGSCDGATVRRCDGATVRRSSILGKFEKSNRTIEPTVEQASWGKSSTSMSGTKLAATRGREEGV